MGLRRRAQPRPRRVLRPRRLRDGHAPDAGDRLQERLPERAARLHGVEPGEGAAAVLAAVLQRAVHAGRPSCWCRRCARWSSASWPSAAGSAACTSRSSRRRSRSRAWLVFNRNEMNLGGTNGLADFKTIFGFPLEPAVDAARPLRGHRGRRWWRRGPLCRWITRSRAGKVLVAIRDSETRVLFSGYSPASYKLFVFVVSASLAGVAGALYAPQVGIITPAKIGVLPSIEMVVWVAAGGRGTLFGAVLGAFGVNWIAVAGSPRATPTSGCSSSAPSSWASCSSSPTASSARSARLAAPRCRRRSRRELDAAALRPAPPLGRRRRATRLRYNSMSDAIIYLEDVTVSYDGFKALDRLNFFMDRRELRVVIGPNGAGKTTLLDVISGRVKPEQRPRDLRPQHRPPAAARERDRRARHRPQVPDAVGVREPHRVGERRAVAAAAEQGRARRRCSTRDGADARDAHRGHAGHGRARRQGRRAGRGAVARREAVARDRHGDGPGSGAAPGGRAGGRHDRRGDGAHRASCCCRSPPSARCSSSSTTWSSCARSRARSPCSTRARCSARARSSRSRATRGCSRSTSGARREGRRRCCPLSGSTSPTAAPRSSGASTSRCRPARSSASWAATASARRRCCKTIMGLLPARGGRVDVRRRSDITRWSPDRRARAGIGYVPQGREIFPHLTRRGESPDGAARLRPRAASSTTRSTLFPALKRLLARKGGVLSGGEQQQLAIGRALLTRPEAPDARRADRGHPALDRARDRGGDPAHQDGARRWPCCSSSSTSTSPSGSPTPT